MVNELVIREGGSPTPKGGGSLSVMKRAHLPANERHRSDPTDPVQSCDWKKKTSCRAVKVRLVNTVEKSNLIRKFSNCQDRQAKLRAVNSTYNLGYRNNDVGCGLVRTMGGTNFKNQGSAHQSELAPTGRPRDLIEIATQRTERGSRC